jgi:hypothetical protein
VKINSSTRPPLREKRRIIPLPTLLKRKTEEQIVQQASSRGKLKKISSTMPPLDEE